MLVDDAENKLKLPNGRNEDFWHSAKFSSSQAHGAESWSFLVPCDDKPIMEGDYRIGGTAMVCADIPIYEIGMSCIGMKDILDRGQIELIRFPFSDLK